MGIIQSLLCSVTFCMERVLSWACCAFALILLMFTLLVLLIYSISVGYHYAQKELATFAVQATSTPKGKLRADEEDFQPMVRLVARNGTQEEDEPPVYEPFKRAAEEEINAYVVSQQTTTMYKEKPRPPDPGQPPAELLPHQRELARKLIGRYRRSKNTTAPAFFRPLMRNTTRLKYFVVY